MKMVRLVRVLAVLLVAGAAWRVAAQDVVTLRDSAELPAQGPITLGQIAELSGAQAAALAGTEITPDSRAAGADGWATIDAQAVREALRKAPGINWGKLIVRGSGCAVRRAGAERPKAAAQPAPEPPVDAGSTVRAMVEQRVRDAIGGTDDEVRLTFEESDRALLDASVGGRTADIQLVGTSERQTVSVKLFEGLRQVAAGSVRVGVSVKRTVAVCTGGLRRGEALTSDNFTVEERWIAPTVRPVDASKALGRVARGRVDPGDIIQENDAESPVLVKKGDLVDVYCLSSSINLKSVARAMENGREGETIRFQTPSAKRSFLARVDGPSRAVTGVGTLPGAADQPAAAETETASAPLRAPSPRSTNGAARVREQAAKGIRFAELGDRPVDRPGAVKKGKVP